MGRDDSDLVILSGEGADGIEIVEVSERDEFDFIAARAAKKMGASVSRNAVNARQYFRPQQLFVAVGVVRSGPSMPDASDHAGLRAKNRPSKQRGGLKKQGGKSPAPKDSQEVISMNS